MSWFNAESAKNRIAASFEVAGGALTDLATSHVVAARQQQQQQQGQGQSSASTINDSTSISASGGVGGATVVKLPPKKGTDVEQASTLNGQVNMSTGTLPVAVRSNEVVSQTNPNNTNNVESAKNNNQQRQQQHQHQINGGTTNPRKNQFSSFFMKNSDKFLANTQRMLERTANVVQTQTQNLQLSLNQQRSATGIRIRDPSLPLDTDALRDAEVVYITDRIITLGHPAMQSQIDPDITASRKLAAVGQLMNKRHFGKYMVWNLSEVEYDYSLLNEQVLAYKFPGSPSPPLGLLLKLIFSMESWLKADPKNVAVLHCLTGKGRTSTVLACFLCWTGEAGFHDPLRALEYIALCKRHDVDQLTIPSQRRYVTYFSNMLDGVRPHHPPLILKRVILSDAAKYEKAPGTASVSHGEVKQDDSTIEMGCSPYIQLFKAGNLILTAAPTLKAPPSTSQSTAGGGGGTNSENADGNKGAGTELPFCRTSDGSITFLVETIIQGDILIRCRHLSQKGQRVSMFRAAFHTGYTPPKVMRLGKLQLDGACTDRRFDDDFFVDLVFEACDVTEASKHLLRSQSSSLTTNNNNSSSSTNVTKDLDGTTEATATKGKLIAAEAENSLNEAAARRARGAIETSDVAKSQAAGIGVSATTYDTMLHRDGRFWDAISKRRQENMKRQDEQDGNGNRSGPTIGRRRNSKTMKKRTAASRQNSSGGGGGGPGNIASGGTSGTASLEDGGSGTNAADHQLTGSSMGMDAFTIGGGDFDFGADFGESTAAPYASVVPTTTSVTAAPVPPKKEKDDLMDALMALDDEDDDEEVDITFSNDDDVDNDNNNNSNDNNSNTNILDQAAKTTSALGEEDQSAAEASKLQNVAVATEQPSTSSAQTISSEKLVDMKETEVGAANPSKEVDKADTEPTTTTTPTKEFSTAATTTDTTSQEVGQLNLEDSEAEPKQVETSATFAETAPAAPVAPKTTPAPTAAPVPAPSAPEASSTKKKDDNDDDDDIDLGLDDLDNEIDALMASNDVGGVTGDDDDDIDIDLDDDDQDLEDLEAFLSG